MALGIHCDFNYMHCGVGVLIRIEINGEFQPLKSKGATDKDIKKYQKTDPLYLLRKALMNKLRSKHWRSAHAAKANWMEAAEKAAKVFGTKAETPALVIIEHALPNKCDIDAPVKVLLDAFQSVLLDTGDDKDIETLVLRKSECKRGIRNPKVVIYAFSREEAGEERIGSESFGKANRDLKEVKRGKVK